MLGFRSRPVIIALLVWYGSGVDAVGEQRQGISADLTGFDNGDILILFD